MARRPTAYSFLDKHSLAHFSKDKTNQTFFSKSVFQQKYSRNLNLCPHYRLAFFDSHISSISIWFTVLTLSFCAPVPFTVFHINFKQNRQLVDRKIVQILSLHLFFLIKIMIICHQFNTFS